MDILTKLKIFLCCTIIKNCLIKKNPTNFSEDILSIRNISANDKLKNDIIFIENKRLEIFKKKLWPFYTLEDIKKTENDHYVCKIKLEYLSEVELEFFGNYKNPNGFKHIINNLENLFYKENENFYNSIKLEDYSIIYLYNLLKNNKHRLEFFYILGIFLNDLFNTLCIFKKTNVNLLNKIKICSYFIANGNIKSLSYFYKLCFEIFEDRTLNTSNMQKNIYRQPCKNFVNLFKDKLSKNFKKTNILCMYNNLELLPNSNKLKLIINKIFNKSKIEIYKQIRYCSYNLKIMYLLDVILKCKDKLMQDICIYSMSYIWNKKRSNISSLSISKIFLLLILNDISNFKFKFDHKIRIFNVIFYTPVRRDFIINFTDVKFYNDFKYKLFLNIYDDILEGQNYLSKLRLYFLCSSRNVQDLYCLSKLEKQPKLLFIIYNLCGMIMKIKKKLVFNF